LGIISARSAENYGVYPRKEGWPKLTWKHEGLQGSLPLFVIARAGLSGAWRGWASRFATRPYCKLTEDVLNPAEIEGEKLDRDQVRSSIARRLGLDVGGLAPLTGIRGLVK